MEKKDYNNRKSLQRKQLKKWKVAFDQKILKFVSGSLCRFMAMSKSVKLKPNASSNQLLSGQVKSIRRDTLFIFPICKWLLVVIETSEAVVQAYMNDIVVLLRCKVSMKFP